MDIDTLVWVVILGVVLTVGYASHRNWTLKNTGSTSMVRGTWWDGVKIFLWIFLALAVCSYLF